MTPSKTWFWMAGSNMYHKSATVDLTEFNSDVMTRNKGHTNVHLMTQGFRNGLNPSQSNSKKILKLSLWYIAYRWEHHFSDVFYSQLDIKEKIFTESISDKVHVVTAHDINV